MAIAKLDTGFNIEIDITLAPLHKRMAARGIDLLICWGYVKFMSLLLNIPSFFIWVFSYSYQGILIGLPALTYHLISETGFNGQSPGKKWLNIQVISTSGGQPAMGQYLLRWMFRLMDFPIVFVGLIVAGEIVWWLFPLLFTGLFAVILTPLSQRIGDLVAGTMVIDLSSRAALQDTIYFPVEENYQPVYPQVMQLSDRDMNTIRNLLRAGGFRKDHPPIRKAAKKLRAQLKITDEADGAELLKGLLKDYNYFTAQENHQ